MLHFLGLACFISVIHVIVTLENQLAAKGATVLVLRYTVAGKEISFAKLQRQTRYEKKNKTTPQVDFGLRPPERWRDGPKQFDT